MKSTKITKGYYQVNHSRGIINLAFDKDLEGENKWNVWSEDFEILEFMDGLWYTKKEALDMIQSEL
jgi:hypothetical protein